MKEEIRKIGTVQKLDKNGYVINDLSMSNIQPEYKPIIEDVMEFYQSRFDSKIHSIYLRGSVAKGAAIHNISDIDTIAISHVDIPEKDLPDRTFFLTEMQNKYSFLNGVEIVLFALDKVMSSKRLQFLFKTQCICIHGKDINTELPDIGLGKWAYGHSNHIGEHLREIKIWLAEEKHTDKDLKEVCSWTMKSIVRIGFELVMEKEQCYTRDLYPCYELFSKNYPNKSKEMRAALKLAIFPTSNMTYMWEVIDALYDFLKEEIEKR